MYKEVTLENFAEPFGRESKWYHATRDFDAAERIVEYGLCPSGNQALQAQQWKLRRSRPVHFASNSTGEWRSKTYPGSNYEFTYDPGALLVRDAERRRIMDENNDERGYAWSRYYMTSLGNVLTWTPVEEPRLAFEMVAHLGRTKRHYEDQPAKRALQKGVDKPRTFTEYMLAGTVYFDTVKCHLIEDLAAYSKFRSSVEPLSKYVQCNIAELRRKRGDAKDYKGEDEEDVQATLEEIKQVSQMTKLVIQRQAAFTRLGDTGASNSKGGTSKEILRTQITQMEAEVAEVADVRGPALSLGNACPGRPWPKTGDCENFVTTTSGHNATGAGKSIALHGTVV